MIYIATQNKLTKEYTLHQCAGDGCVIPQQFYSNGLNIIYVATTAEKYQELVRRLEKERDEWL